jgi:hypothetical protein
MYKQIFTPPVAPIADYNTDDSDDDTSWDEIMKLFKDTGNTLAVNIWKESLSAYNLKDRVCAECGKVQKKMNKCARCKTIHYCSADCQKKHYKYHKSCCKNIKNETALAGNKVIVCMEAITNHFIYNPNIKNSAITKSGIRYWKASIKDWDSNGMVLISTTKEEMGKYFPYNPVDDTSDFIISIHDEEDGKGRKMNISSK